MWTPSQINHFVKQLKAKWSPHWHLLVPELQASIVDARVLTIVCGLDRETIPVAAIDELRATIHAGMGTEGF